MGTDTLPVWHSFNGPVTFLLMPGLLDNRRVINFWRRKFPDVVYNSDDLDADANGDFTTAVTEYLITWYQRRGYELYVQRGIIDNGEDVPCIIEAIMGRVVQPMRPGGIGGSAAAGPSGGGGGGGDDDDDDENESLPQPPPQNNTSPPIRSSGNQSSSSSSSGGAGPGGNNSSARRSWNTGTAAASAQRAQPPTRQANPSSPPSTLAPSISRPCPSPVTYRKVNPPAQRRPRVSTSTADASSLLPSDTDDSTADDNDTSLFDDRALARANNCGRSRPTPPAQPQKAVDDSSDLFGDDSAYDDDTTAPFDNTQMLGRFGESPAESSAMGAARNRANQQQQQQQQQRPRSALEQLAGTDVEEQRVIEASIMANVRRRQTAAAAAAAGAANQVEEEEDDICGATPPRDTSGGAGRNNNDNDDDDMASQVSQLSYQEQLGMAIQRSILESTDTPTPGAAPTPRQQQQNDNSSAQATSTAAQAVRANDNQVFPEPMEIDNQEFRLRTVPWMSPATRRRDYPGRRLDLQ